MLKQLVVWKKVAITSFLAYYWKMRDKKTEQCSLKCSEVVLAKVIY